MRLFKKIPTNFKTIFFEVIGILFLLLIWEIIALCVNDSFIFPHLDGIFIALVNILEEVTTWTAIGQSLLRTIISLVISFIFAFILGLIAGLFKPVKDFLAPLVYLLKLVPTPCVVFFIILFFLKEPNIGSLIITFLIVFPILYESFVEGLTNIDPSIKLSLRLEGYYSKKSIFKVLIPESMPYLLLGCINSIGLGVKVSIMSEILIGTDSLWGIGRLIQIYKINAEYDKMIALTLLVIFVFIIIDLLFSYIKIFFKKTK